MGTRRCPMPWTVSTPMTQRLDFVEDFARGLYSMSELCAHYQISRRVGYKWLQRYRLLGLAGLADQRRTPHYSPTRTGPDIVALLVAARRAHPTWGPRKLLPYLARRQPNLPGPVASTVGTT